MKRDKHPLAGKALEFLIPQIPGERFVFEIEDWWDNISPKPWTECEELGNPACVEYGRRCIMDRRRRDNEVVYGKLRGKGLIVHNEELRNMNPNPGGEDLYHELMEVLNRPNFAL